MRRIFVSGASGIVGYGILRSLRQSKKPYYLVGSSIYNDSVAPAFCDAFELAPPTDSPEYINWLLGVLLKHNIDMLIPGIEADMFNWMKHKYQISTTGAFPLLNEPNLVSLCGDKWIFYQHLVAAKIDSVIESSIEQNFDLLRSNFGLPFLLKPRRGFGSKGIVRVDSEEIFERHRDKIGPLLMCQPIIGNDEEEFTTSSFCDGQGSFFASMTLRRKLSRDGFTDKAEVSDTEEFNQVIRELCFLLHPLGPTNFQFRRCAEGLKLLEINPRISSSTSIRTAFGYNESEMAVEYFLNQRPPVQPAIRLGRAVRYIEEYIFYENSIHF